MDATIAGAAAQAGGSIVSDIFNMSNASQQRDWEERMSNTAYTRAVANMVDAGLNPALMYGSAGPASTPSYTPAVTHNPMEGFAKNSIEGRKADSDITVNNASIQKIAADADLSKEQALTQGTQRLVNTALEKKILQESKVPDYEIDRIMKNIELMQSQKDLTNAQKIKTEAEGKKSTFFGNLYQKGTSAIENLENGMKNIGKFHREFKRNPNNKGYTGGF